ncbi:MAG TPA: NAD(P)-dependent oxidoreductase [Propionicimonas sp.]|uniref:precorrin-2 dehydrogenase/sirohydrochlorin ferrochelatase family protein n=1 Tax=Propionicimonas sp. TaxID=1955623 RepID=UPI002F3EE476
MTEQPPSPTPPGQGAPVYLTGLLLAGRKVVAVGGGRVHARRVPKLLAAGADVVVVAPLLHPGLAALAASGQITWQERTFEDDDLDGAWYVLAATDDPQVNAQVAAAAEARHTFCVRADRGEAGSAWTPATAAVPGATIAVQASHDPMHARALRDRLVELLGEAGE